MSLESLPLYYQLLIAETDRKSQQKINDKIIRNNRTQNSQLFAGIWSGIYSVNGNNKEPEIYSQEQKESFVSDGTYWS